VKQYVGRSLSTIKKEGLICEGLFSIGHVD
jgi:hypothetical protein